MIVLGAIFFWVLPTALFLWVLNGVRLEYRRDRIPILLYHRLVAKEAARADEAGDEEIIYACYGAAFAEQMAYLHEAGYTTLDFDDYLAIRSGEARLPGKPVMVTFDDGYLSSYTMAYPVLKRHGQKATIYAVTRANAYSLGCVEGVDRFLEAAEIAEMAEHGISIQSHTLTHCVLCDLDNENALHELTESKRQLSAITGRPVNHIAIPRCGYSRRIKRLVKQAGYRTACGTRKGSANLQSDPWDLPRIVIERDMTVDDFARGLTPRWSLVLRIVGSVKRIPERVGGPAFARRLRGILYTPCLRFLFKARNLKRIMAGAAVLYLCGIVLFTWHLLAG